MTVRTEYIGQGIGFPVRVDHLGGIALAGGAEGIDVAIHLILSTAPGERVMRPNFGCAVWDHVFDTATNSVLGEMERKTEDALAQWEPRIDVEEVHAEVDPDDHARVLISIGYSIRATNDRRNLVYPFYVIPQGGEA